MSERIGVIRRALLLPAEDLALEFTKAGYYGLGDDIKLGLSLLYGIGPNAPRLVAVDDTGKLLIAATPLAPIASEIVGPTGLIAAVSQIGNADSQPTTNLALTIAGYLQLFRGSVWDRWRSASAANLAAQSGLGVALTSTPGTWSAVSTPAAGVQATASQAAGAAGVRHICAGIVVTFGAIAAPVATQLAWNLRDGATGAGAILASGQIAVPAAVFQGQPIVLTGLSIPGSAATAMTLEFSAALANLLEGCTLLGFDTT